MNDPLPFEGDRFYADLDNDGDLDIVDRLTGTSWYATDGNRFEVRPFVGFEPQPSARSEYQPVDLDGDKDADIVGVMAGSAPGLFRIAWFENIDGAGTFDSEQLIGEIQSLRRVFPVDVDQDDDLDILVQTQPFREPSETIWFSNNGDGSFSEANSANEILGRVGLLVNADGNGDGLLDKVIAVTNSVISWERARTNTISLGPAPTLIAQLTLGRTQAADLDGDGDLDLIEQPTWGRLHWRENVDGRIQSVDTRGPVGLLIEDRDMYTWSMRDVDGDGDLDIISAGLGKVAWHENRLLGDANDDGEVGFDDFLSLSANFGAIDAAWEDGDFTGDGEVSFEDFLALSANFSQSRVARE